MNNILILDPVADSEARSIARKEHPESLAGSTIGFLDNTKPNFDIFLNKLEELLKTEFGVQEVIQTRKNSRTLPASEEILDELAEKCDVVVSGLSDWGSCTSWSIHDSIELEKRGIPTVTISTTEFLTLARIEAKVLGIPELAIMPAPHPIAGIPPEEVQKKVEQCFPQIVSMLTKNN